MTKKADKFYKSGRWMTMRGAAMARDRWVCTECRRYGKRAEAEAVHHIFPRIEFPEHEWAMWNLTSLCDACHDGMHDRETRALTKKGVELLKRTARRMGMKVPLRYSE